MEIIKQIISNWFILLVIAASVAAVMTFVTNWMQKPTKEQVNDLKEWLKYAVAEAEKALGSGTGQLKLRAVYDMAIRRFSWIKMIMSFE